MGLHPSRRWWHLLCFSISPNDTFWTLFVLSCHFISVTYMIYMRYVSILFNVKTVFPRYRIPVLKIRRSWDHLIFNLGITILVRWHLYIEPPPDFCHWCCVVSLIIPLPVSQWRIWLVLPNFNTPPSQNRVHNSCYLVYSSGKIDSQHTTKIGRWQRQMSWCVWMKTNKNLI